MKIALDYDGTYTADPDFWEKFIKNCEGKHTIYIVTMRHPHEKFEIKPSIPVIYTSRKAKKLYCEEHGAFFDIWIDDNPEWLFTDSI